MKKEAQNEALKGASGR